MVSPNYRKLFKNYCLVMSCLLVFEFRNENDELLLESRFLQVLAHPELSLLPLNLKVTDRLDSYPKQYPTKTKVIAYTSLCRCSRFLCSDS